MTPCAFSVWRPEGTASGRWKTGGRFRPAYRAGRPRRSDAVREHRRFARARPGRLIEPGPDRVEPRCPHYTRDECGGCQLQHLALPAQQEARRAFVGDALRRLAHLEVSDPELEPSTKAFEYRTKLTLAAADGGRVVGLRRFDRPGEIFPLDRCHITIPELMTLWSELRALGALLPENPGPIGAAPGSSRWNARRRPSSGTSAWAGGERLHAELARRGQAGDHLVASREWRAEGSGGSGRGLSRHGFRAGPSRDG